MTSSCISRLPVPLSMICVATLLAGCPGGDDTGESGTDDATSSTATDSTTSPTGTTEGTTTEVTSSTDPGTDTDTDASATDATTGSGSSGSGSESSSGGTSTGDVACAPPQELGVYTPAEGDARGFAIDGDTVYLATRDGGLDIVDISDPTAPALVGSVEVSGLPLRVAVEGDYVYLGKRGSGYSVVDVSTPATPVEVAMDDTADAQDVAIGQGSLLTPDNTGLVIYDLVAPEAPVELPNDLVIPGSSESIVVGGTIAYVASTAGGATAIDLTDPGAPTILSTFETSANGDHLAVDGTTVYFADQDGVTAIDFADPAAPAALGMFERDRSEFVATENGRVFILGADTASVDVPFLQIVDFSDPANPVDEHTAFDELDDPEWIAVDAGRLLFSTDMDDALHIVDACPEA